MNGINHALNDLELVAIHLLKGRMDDERAKLVARIVGESNSSDGIKTVHDFYLEIGDALMPEESKKMRYNSGKDFLMRSYQAAGSMMSLKSESERITILDGLRIRPLLAFEVTQ